MLSSARGSPDARSNRPPASQDDDDAASRQVSPPRNNVGGGGNAGDDQSVDDASVARAAAEVSVMAPAGPSTGLGGEAGRATIGGSRGPAPGVEAANAAIQGTEEGQAFEVVDEGGELVRVRFHEFLHN